MCVNYKLKYLLYMTLFFPQFFWLENGAEITLWQILSLLGFNCLAWTWPVSDSLFPSYPLPIIPWPHISTSKRFPHASLNFPHIFVLCHFYSSHALPCVCSCCSMIQECRREQSHTCLGSLMRTIHCNVLYVEHFLVYLVPFVLLFILKREVLVLIAFFRSY